MSRRKKSRRPQVSPKPAVVEIPEPSQGEPDSMKVAALRCVLAALDEDEAARDARLRREFFALLESSPGALMGVTYYALFHLAEGLMRDYGGRAEAVDEVTKNLARAVLGDA